MTAEAVVEDADEQVPADLRAGRVQAIIRHHALYSAAGGLIPVPALDIAASMAVQVRMIARLCDEYELAFSQQALKSAISALLAAGLPTATVGYPTISLVKTVPVVGSLLGLATMPAYNAAVTWALGRVFAWHFARGGSLDNVDAGEMSGRFTGEVKAGIAEVKNKVTGGKAAAGDAQ